MLKSANNHGKKVQPTDRPQIKAIKNGHTPSELAESGKRWANHTGPYMTLEEVLIREQAKQKTN